MTLDKSFTEKME